MGMGMGIEMGVGERLTKDARHESKHEVHENSKETHDSAFKLFFFYRNEEMEMEMEMAEALDSLMAK